jgi:hypothetical protein
MLSTWIPLTAGTGLILFHLCDELVRSGNESLPVGNYFRGCWENRIADGLEKHKGDAVQIVEILSLTLPS